MTLAPPAIVMPISSARCSAYVNTPADTSHQLPTLAPLLNPQATSRTDAVVNGAIEGAATGALYALLLTGALSYIVQPSLRFLAFVLLMSW